MNEDERTFREWLKGLTPHDTFIGKGWVARRRTVNPKNEVEMLLASLKTEGGFTREVKWGK